MSTTAWFLAVCAVASVLHRAPVVSQCTTNHCHDDDKNTCAPMALVDRLQDTVGQQQDSLEQQQGETTTLKQTVEQQQREMTTLNETVEQQRKQNQEEQRQLATLKETVEQQRKQIQAEQRQLTTLKQTVEQQRKQNQAEQTQLTTLNETVALQAKQLARLEEKLRDRAEYSVRDVHDCADLRSTGISTSGVYDITLAGRTVKIWCDMTSEGKSWLVFQRRVDNTVGFNLDWKSYKEGFGDPSRDFWLGNDNLHAVTAQKKYTLRVDLADFEGHTRYAEYTDFAVANEVNKYRLTFGSYSGTAGDSLRYHYGMAFSTRDRNNDQWGGAGGCAADCQGAWWYNGCHNANLNGLYLHGANSRYCKGIVWYHWLGHNYSLKNVAMKIRPQ